MLQFYDIALLVKIIIRYRTVSALPIGIDIILFTYLWIIFVPHGRTRTPIEFLPEGKWIMGRQCDRTAPGVRDTIDHRLPPRARPAF
jgi:hypothetical protein